MEDKIIIGGPGYGSFSNIYTFTFTISRESRQKVEVTEVLDLITNFVFENYTKDIELNMSSWDIFVHFNNKSDLKNPDKFYKEVEKHVNKNCKRG